MGVTVLDIYNHLISQGVCTTNNLFIDNLPDGGPYMMVSTYGGRGPERDADGNIRSFPMLQVRVQYPGPTTLGAWTWMAQAEAALLVVNATLGSNLYQQIFPVASAQPMGFDEKGNFQLVQNFNLERSE